MKINVRLFLVLSAFYVVSGVIYTVWAINDPHHGAIEWVGTPALLLLGVMFGFIAFYLGRTHRAQGGELAEDRVDASVDDGDPEVGHFSPWSWWPVSLGGSVALVFLGVAIGTWIFLIGVTVAIIAIVGWTYEYYRGYFAS